MISYEDIGDYARDIGEDPDVVEELFELYDQGFTANEISATLDLEKAVVMWVLEAEGLDPLNYGD